MRFKLSKMFLVVILLIFSVFADVDLTGKVLDRNNNPVNGVIATLSGAGISDTTGSDGVYHLIGGIGIKNPHVNSFKNGWNNSRFYLLVTGNKYISIDIRNLLGRHVANIFSKKLSSGRHSIIPGISNLADGMYIVSLNVDGKILYSGKIAHLGGRKNTVHTRLGDNFSDLTSVATQVFAEDTLSLVKEGQVITIQEILDLIDTLDDVFIVQRDVYGDLGGFDTANTIEAVITGDSIPEPKIVELWHNVANNSYSGFVYFIHIVNVVDYNVFVKVYDDSGRFIGRSVDVPFTSNAGDIEVPIFDIENAKPWVSLGNDDTVSIYDTIYLKAIVVDSFRTREIVKWEWDINGSGFVDGSEDMTIVAPDTLKRSGEIITIVKVMDADSNVAIDTHVVTVVQDIPIPTASIVGDSVNLFVWGGEQIELKGVAVDLFGSIVKWEWDLGNGFVQTSTSDTFIVSVTGDYEYILRVTDDDDNTAVDTANIGILGMNRQMSFIPAKGKKYWMGSIFASPVHEVEFTRSFWMDTTEVTQIDYDSLMGVNPSNWKYPNHPVENVAWCDAVLYCNARSNRDSLDTIYSYDSIVGVSGDSIYELTNLSIDMSLNGYRLPTEAEWEFACRAQWGGFWNDYEEFYWGGIATLNNLWFYVNSGDSTNVVGTKLPNAFRLYDMGGNVYEWSNNWWEHDYTAVNGGVDPIGPVSGDVKTIRGGYFESRSENCGSSFRSFNFPINGPTFINKRDSSTGFRTVRTAE